jgi:uncharacterized protein (DUF1810 family)
VAAETHAGAIDHDAADPFDLSRFLAAQEGVYESALQELRAGRKRSHWMWFIFPQIDGLGTSATARRYAIRGLVEARAYLAHPVLGARVAECTRTVNGLQGRTALQIFGTPDHLKFRSSMTLFELAAGARSGFSVALDKYCSGKRDPETLRLLRTPDTTGKPDQARWPS